MRHTVHVTTLRRTLVFLQLPRLDPDVRSPGENVPLAAACLQAALERSDEAKHWNCAFVAGQDSAPDVDLLEELVGLGPGVVAATCYLWNVERTLSLLRVLRRRVPGLRVVLGGPEAAREHPLLFAAGSPADAVVVGEGEAVFPGVLRALRTGGTVDARNVAIRGPQAKANGRAWRWGGMPPALLPLSTLLPAADAPVHRPDAQGMAYLETSRGCPLRCAFCCYNLRRATGSAIPPGDVEERVRVLAQRGAREIRLVDPTFNAHPQFDAVVAALSRANPARRIAFFVEIRADTLTDAQAAALAEAGVVEAEVGIQSTDPQVLRTIRRGTDPERVVRGIERLRGHGIRPTIDFLYGLPRQGRDDLDRSLAWLERFPDAHPQFMPLLLLPGTELRDRAAELGLRAQRLPPYRVLSTDRLGPRALRGIEEEAARRLGGFDSPTRRFAAWRLADLFPNPVRVPCEALPGCVRPRRNRQALLIRGEGLFERRDALAALLRACVAAEPHVLWQFVLEPCDEEPLDLLDRLVRELRRMPSHWLDRLVAPPGRRVLAARRLFVRPVRGADVGRDWLAACDELLAGACH